MRGDNRTLEYTMTHRVVGGMTERYVRPDGVRDMALRLRKWSGTPEICQSCSTLPAMCVRAGTPLCSRCRSQRDLRFNRLPDLLGAKAWPTRADDDEVAGKQFRGHAIVFNSKSVDLGGFTEIIRPAAADRMEAEKPDLRGLWSHDSSLVLARSTAGTLRARKVIRGVAIEIDPPRWASGYVESVERRDVTGMSFGFWALDDDWHLEEGEPVREVFDMHVFEFSPVSFPAYEATDIRVVQGTQRSSWQIEDDTAHRLRLADLGIIREVDLGPGVRAILHDRERVMHGKNRRSEP